MFKKVIMTTFIVLAIFVSFQEFASAKDYWVWGDDSIDVYVDDSSISWKNEENFLVKINTVSKSHPNGYWRSNQLNFFKRIDRWYYMEKGMTDPVSYSDCTGYVLDFVLKYRR